LSANAIALRKTQRGQQVKEYLVTHYVFNAFTRSAAALLILSASIGISTSQAYPSRDFDAVPSASDSNADAQATDAKAWYDRDFDFSVESELGPRETTFTQEFDAVGIASGRIRGQSVLPAR
jgi:hypothetical protein